MTEPTSVDLTLWVDVPMTGLRPMWARTYQETFPAPPPSTVFGMLLSLAGVERGNRDRHSGVRMAIALAENADTELWQRREKARLLRKFRRVAQNPGKGKIADPMADRRPDYQELLLGLQFWLWLDDTYSQLSLSDAVRSALDPDRRGAVIRHGALCLGESSHMVNDIRVDLPGGKGRFVAPSERGDLTMPVWTDHVSDRSRMRTFEIRDLDEVWRYPPEDCWVDISP